MIDVMVYDKDYDPDQVLAESLCWHSNHRMFADLVPGDRLWIVTSGKALRRENETAGYLVAMWPVRQVVTNPDDDPEFPARRYGHRVIADVTEAIYLEPPVCVDSIIRGEGYDESIPIGRFLRGPRRLTDADVRRLLATAGGELAHHWLAGRSKYKTHKRHEDSL